MLLVGAAIVALGVGALLFGLIRVAWARTRGGHLATLRGLRKQDLPCPWDYRACSLAASRGELATLQWLRAQQPPCPWVKEHCLQSIPDERHYDRARAWVRAQ